MNLVRTCSGAEAAYVERCDDQPAPDPARAASTARLTRLLLSSDLLRVAAWVAVGLCLGSGFSFVVGGLLFFRFAAGWRLRSRGPPPPNTHT